VLKVVFNVNTLFFLIKQCCGFLLSQTVQVQLLENYSLAQLMNQLHSTISWTVC